MEQISTADALSVLSKWERQNQRISVFCFGDSIALSSKDGKVGMCLDQCIQLSLLGDSVLRIFTSEAVFSRVGPEDFPAESVSLLPKFQQGIRVDFPSKEMRWYLLA
jgi:hypothetical protein